MTKQTKYFELFTNRGRCLIGLSWKSIKWWDTKQNTDKLFRDHCFRGSKGQKMTRKHVFFQKKKPKKTNEISNLTNSQSKFKRFISVHRAVKLSSRLEFADIVHGQFVSSFGSLQTSSRLVGHLRTVFILIILRKL